MADCEKINPYDNDRPKSEQVEEMFDNIASAYDFMNRAMTLGIDRRWRRKAIKLLKNDNSRPPRYILDVATGTGDLAILLAKKLDPISIVGVDISEGMIERGRKKINELGLADLISLRRGDCLQLPFTDGAFDCVTVAYGVRNFEDLLAGYREIFRVLKPDGRLCVIELSTPSSPLIKPLYDFYTRKVIPFVGKLVSKDVRAYSYLPESIAAVPQGSAMASILMNAGFREVNVKRLTFGVCSIYIATK